MAKSKNSNSLSDRRDFLRNAAVGTASLLASATAARALDATTTPAEADPSSRSHAEVFTEGKSGSDFMIDCIKSLGFEYSCSVAGSSFRGIHESLLNYGGNKNPEFITCLHEECAVGMCHGYSKIEGKPVVVFTHGTVGLQHASMALYNAYCDRVPIYMVIGNVLDANKRDAAYGEWAHSVQDAAAIVRDFTKWDDTPISLQHFAESSIRAYKIAVTPPAGPVVLVADSELQENPIPDQSQLSIPKLALPSPPQGDSGAVAEAARLLVQADNPVIIVDRSARTQAGTDRLIELAEALQAPVIDKASRMNFPSRHALNHTLHSGPLIANADVVIGLEATDLWTSLNTFRDQVDRTHKPATRPDVKVISVTAGDLYIKANYQDFYRYTAVDLAMAADAEATLPSLVEEVKRQTTSDRRVAFQNRGAKLAAARKDQLEQARTDASYGWNASPVSTARLAMELWAQIKDEDWSMVSDVRHLNMWPLKLWDFQKHYQYIGISGGGGVGYNAPATAGAALANRKYGRLSVNIQCDGDLLFAPTVLWTCAHHRIPILNVMFNNRAYHEELMHIQRMANRHNRGISADTIKVGTVFDDPYIDFSKIAQGMGMYAEGPIENPNDLGPAIRRALAVVKRGEPALIDVVTQPR